MANQTQIPVIQTPDANQTQLQQNTNKVLRNLNNQIVDIQTFVNQNNIIGEIKLSHVSLSDWQAVAGTDWIAANGQSCVGTKYASQYGFNTVPNISITGTNAYIKVN